jgi:DNA mismatch repair protein MutS2
MITVKQWELLNIEKNKATVNYGVFLSKVSLDELELVEG